MNELVNILLMASAGIILLALALSMWRFFTGPTLVDRTISFDITTVGSLALIALLAYFSQRQIYLDVSIIYGLLSFVAVVVVGKYIEKSL